MNIQISLKAARVNAEMTQRDAARAIGVDVTTIIGWENGRTSPKAAQLEKLCEMYHIPIDCIRLSGKSS